MLERDRVVALDTRAHADGLRLGMRRAGVLTLAPHVRLRDRDLGAEATALEGIATALMQFSPLVSHGGEDVVLVDVSASLRLFGGIRAIARAFEATVDTLGYTTSIALAPTGIGAWLLARSGGARALSFRSLARAVGALPVALLPAARRYADWFEGIGCTSISGVLRLPRAGLKKRCGTAILDALDCANGEAPEVFEWIIPPATFCSRIELLQRIEHSEAVLFGARRLIVQLVGWLSSRQVATTHLALRLGHERGRDAIDPTVVDLALAEPATREDHLLKLLRERISRLELVAPVIAIELEALKVVEGAPISDCLFPEPGGSPSDHKRLLELLTARLGAENVRTAAPVADHRPEVACRWLPIGETRAKVELPCDLPRPIYLLAEPVRLIVREHRPVYGTPLRMVSPGERIEAGWFGGASASRDYFVAEASNHVCYWVFRERIGTKATAEGEEARWFLHGLFG